MDPSRSINYYSYSESLLLNRFIYGPPGETSQSDLKSLVPEGNFYNGFVDPINWNRTKAVTTADSLYASLEAMVGDRSAWSVGGIFLGDSDATFAYSSDMYDSISTAVFTQSVLNQVLMDTPIAFSSETFSQRYTPYDFLQGLIVVFTVLGFAVYPGFFSLYPTVERIRNVR